jgi:SWI/SNF-related matrix-associated actin-dependent regulator of chromatin subfamily A containing DEAD/H box 1
MGYDPSSPLPIRQSFIPATPTFTRLPFDSDQDELAIDDHIPCSPYVTQPTQIVNRTTLTAALAAPSIRSSLPASNIIEVPASSPVQRSSPVNSAGGRLASRLAPAGTFFNPPQPRPQPAKMKRPAAEPPVIIISDDEDDLSPNRGDILPTTFKRHVSSFRYDPKGKIDPKDKIERLRAKVQDLVGEDVRSTKEYRNILQACNNDVDAAVNRILDDIAGSKKGKAEVKQGYSPLPSPSISRPQKPLRRLMRGLPPRSSPVSSQEVSAPVKRQADREIEVLNLEDDDYDAQSSPSEDEDFQSKTLKFINTSTIDDLSAMTGMKVDELQLVVNRRPYDSLVKVTKVYLNKSGARKSAKVAVGETVVERIEQFTKAVEAIDEIVRQCEEKAKGLRDEMNMWDLDFAGKKRNIPVVADNDLPLTPKSLIGIKYSDPPISREPKLMQGHCNMRPFQLYGLNWMSLLYKSRIGCILADEMGLGKTCQVISLICHMVQDHEEHGGEDEPWPNLIVVPPSTYSNWLAEFERFAPRLSVVGYQGSQSERRQIAAEILENPSDVHVVLSTYSQLGTEDDLEAMVELQPNVAIWDEGHKMKNPKTKVYSEMIRIPAQWRMILTGTPVQNNLMEMIALLNFIDPKMFRCHMEQINYLFNQKVTLRNVGSGAFLYPQRVQRARTILEPFILQRRKQQVLSDMAAKVCNVVYHDLAKTQRPIYEDFERLFKSETRTVRKGGRSNDRNNPWMQLRKAAIHPLLFRRHFDDDTVEQMAKLLMKKVPQAELQQPHLHHLIAELNNCSDFELHLWCRDYHFLAKFDISDSAWMESGKVQKLLELCHKYRNNGDRVLVFSKFAKVIEILKEVFATADIEYRVLSGATSVAERQVLIDEFNSNPRITAFLLTTAAGGTGINLTAANKVVIFDQSDNPQDDIQAENRAHRLGQTREVEVIRLIASHTIEELIYKACQKKIELAEKVTGTDDTNDVKEAEAEATLEKEVRKMMNDQLTPP